MLLLQIGIVNGPLGVVRPARAATGDLRIGTLQTIDSLNPYKGLNDPSYLLYGLLYDYAYAFDQDGNFIPNLITDATCDATCQNWTYTLRTGVKWSDGTDFTAADVNFTFNFDSQNLKFVWAFEPYFNQVAQCALKQVLGCGARINPANSNQVIVYFKHPYAPGKSLFAPIVQAAQWGSVAPSSIANYANSNPIGTGPFIADPNIYNEFKSLPAGPLHVSVNTNYHPVGNHSGPSHIQNIYIYEFNDVNSLVLALEAGGANGGVDVAAMTTTTLPALDGVPNVMTQRALQAIQEWNEIGISQINSTKLNPARLDTSVRLAMAHATNKDYIVQQFYDNQGLRGDSQVSPVTPDWWYKPGADNLTFDLTVANQILDQAGYTTWSGGSPGNGYRSLTASKQVTYEPPCYQCVNPPPTTITISAGQALQFTLAIRPKSQFPEEYNTAYYIQAEYAKIGIQITVLEEKTENALSTDVYGGNVEMYIWYWSADQDPNYILSMESSWTLDGWNDNYWNNATYNHYYLQQLADQNVTQRQADVKMAQKIYYGSAAYIIYIFPFGQWAMRTDDWTGWGDWSAHPYRQLNAYWGANPLFFDLQPVACPNCVINQPPTHPVIQTNSPYLKAYVNQTVAFSASTTDVETTDLLNWSWDWGEGNRTITHGTAAPPATSSATYAWPKPGNYTVNVSVSDGWNTAVYTLDPVYVNVSARPLNLGALAGFVNDSVTKLPIAGAQVLASGHFSTTGAIGLYAILLPPGSYTATASKSLYADQSLAATITANTTTWLNFTLTPNEGWIVGTVTSTVGNASIKASIFVKDATGHVLSIGTNDQGQFNISLEPGTYKVNASANGYQNNSVSGIVVATGQAHSVWLQLTPNQSGEQGLSPLVIGGIVAAVVIVAAAVLGVFLMKRRKKKETEDAKVEFPPKT